MSALNAKARKLIGVMFRKFYKDAHPTSLLNLYLANIRPHLEYCSPVWDPYHRKDIDMLEKAQKFVLRVCLKDWSSQYETLLQQSKIQSLSERRTKTNLTYIHKIVHERLTSLEHLSKKEHSSTAADQTTLALLIASQLNFLIPIFPRQLHVQKCVHQQGHPYISIID